jgi:hypothetical protein
MSVSRLPGRLSAGTFSSRRQADREVPGSVKRRRLPRAASATWGELSELRSPGGAASPSPRWTRSGATRPPCAPSCPARYGCSTPFHVTRLGLTALDEVRRRVQQDTLHWRGDKADPLHRIRRLLRRAPETLSERAWARLETGLGLGDPPRRGHSGVDGRAQGALPLPPRPRPARRPPPTARRAAVSTEVTPDGLRPRRRGVDPDRRPLRPTPTALDAVSVPPRQRKGPIQPIHARLASRRVVPPARLPRVPSATVLAHRRQT